MDTFKKWFRQKRAKGLCFSYMFGSKIITSVLHQWPKSLIQEVMVSGFDLLKMNRTSKVILLEWLLPLLLKRIKGLIQFIHGSSAIHDFICLSEIEIRGILWHYYKGFLNQQSSIVLFFCHLCQN